MMPAIARDGFSDDLVGAAFAGGQFVHDEGLTQGEVDKGAGEPELSFGSVFTTSSY